MKGRKSPAAGRERRSPTPAAARKRTAIRTLKAALAEDRFDLHYQPIVLGLRVVAEGVESPEERDFLIGHACDLLQGYLISPAMSASDVIATFARPPVPSPEVA